MRKRFDHLNLSFTIGSLHFTLYNIVYECLEKPIPRHSHSKNSYEIHYISKGQGTATIQETTYPLTPNTLFITGPAIAHEQISRREDPMYEYCIYLEVTPAFDPATTQKDRQFALKFAQTSFWIGQDLQKISPLFLQLFEELEQNLPGKDILAGTLCKQILVQIIRNYEIRREKGTVSVLASPTDFHSLKKYPAGSGFKKELADNKYLMIEECFLFEYPDLTLEKLANRLNLSVRQVERLLKEQYAMTFAAKKTEARMSAACVMLADPSIPITVISERIGYSSVEHFSAAFRHYCHITPSKYRRRLINPGEIGGSAEL